MFSQTCVIPSVHSGGGGIVHGKGAWVAKWGCAWQRGVCVAKGGVHSGGHAWHGVCMARGHLCRGAMCGRGACVVGWACMEGEITTAEDGTHPTVMHSCLFLLLPYFGFTFRIHFYFKFADL